MQWLKPEPELHPPFIKLVLQRDLHPTISSLVSAIVAIMLQPNETKWLLEEERVKGVPLRFITPLLILVQLGFEEIIELLTRAVFSVKLLIPVRAISITSS